MMKPLDSFLTRIFPATFFFQETILENIHRDSPFWRVCTVSVLSTVNIHLVSIMIQGFFLRCILSTDSVFTSQRTQLVCIINICHINACRPSRKASLLFSIGPRWLMPRMYCSHIDLFTTLRRSTSHR